MAMKQPFTVAAALALLTAAAPAPDPLLSRLIADARTVAPATLAFERQSRTISQEAGGESGTQNRIDRWDGRAFTLVSIDGKPPAPKALADFRKATTGRPVPGYHRLAELLAAGAVRQTDAQGRTVYHLAALPKGSINIGKDVSADITAEFIVDSSGAQPYISRARFALPKPLSFFMVAKLDSLEIINDYKVGSDGRPYLARAVQVMAGAQFGKRGSTRTETSYTLLR
jgi:hypothetical protein